jgi:hypothetical protein
VKRKSKSQQRTRVFRGAGVSPAIFLASTHCKNAGETPALQHIAPQAQCMAWLPNSESVVEFPGNGGRKNAARCKGLRDSPEISGSRQNNI